MADVIISPNMLLPVPVVGQDPGPDWANNINACLGILDQHDHSSGEGVQINPDGIDINMDLPMNGNNLTLVNTVRFNNLTGSLSGTTPNLGCIYEAVNELYYNDGVGNVVQLTKAGAINATSSGISSGTASASFSGGVLVVDSNVNTPGNIQAGSILFGNNVPASNFATVEPPSALASNYTITLPPTNTTGSTVFLTYDASNDMGIGPAVSGGITRANQAPVGQQISASCGTFNTNSGSFVQVTNMSVTLTTSGRPVFIGLQPDGSPPSSNTPALWGMQVPALTTDYGLMGVNRGATTIVNFEVPVALNGPEYNSFPLPGFLCLDTPTAGTYTYTLQMAVIGNVYIFMNYAVLVAYEL
jgi:hypothetical protein